MSNEIIDLKTLSNLDEMENYNKISDWMKGSSDAEIIIGMIKLAGKLSEEALSIISGMYIEKLRSREKLELKDLQTEADIMRSFNDNISKVMKTIDLNNSETVRNFEKTCESFRENLRTQFGVKAKKKFLFFK